MAVTEGEVERKGAPARGAVASIVAEMERMRGRTRALVEPLDEEALRRRANDFMSPLLWDLGHIADFERLWLVDAVQGRDGRLQGVFDAQETPRAARRGETLPGKRDALAQLDRVRADVLRLLEAVDTASDDPLLREGFVYRMVLQHEAQHQETMLQSLDLPASDVDGRSATAASRAISAAAIGGASPPAGPIPRAAGAAGFDDSERIRIPAGMFPMGTEDRAWAYDNERRQHEVGVAAFDIERFPVSNRRWLEFIDDGGYRRDELWSPMGARWRGAQAVACPQGWFRRGRRWKAMRFGCEQPLDPGEPVQHVSFWEAEAFAAWAGGRLPSEAEWERAVAWGPDRSAESAPLRVEDAFGAVYQWTSSSFRPYPGFEAFPYAGYSEVFFGDTYRVLRGASWAADRVLWRPTYRNWDLPERRQIFAGVRLVYDA